MPSRIGTKDMSFDALFSTNPGDPKPQPLFANDAARPLISNEGVQPLIAIEEAAGASQPIDGGFEPLPAPAPLFGEDAPLALMPTPPEAQPDAGAPRARVLMTPRADGNSNFFTQLYAQDSLTPSQ